MDSKKPLILASASPRRQALLAEIGLRPLIVPTHLDETSIPGESPGEMVQRLALAKAEVVARQRAGVVIGADTTVVLAGRSFGKPADTAEAIAMLRRLSGNTHRVITGFAVLDGQRRVAERVETMVTIKPLSDVEIFAYVATSEPLDKAGAYANQGIGQFMVTRIEGSYTNVVGLPIPELLNALHEIAGISLFC